MPGKGKKITIPTAIARVWARITGSKVIAAGVGTEARNAGGFRSAAAIGAAVTIFVNTGPSGRPTITADSLPVASVRFMGYHCANVQFDVNQVPCRPV